MQEERLKKAIDEFILQRINDCGFENNTKLETEYENFNKVLEILTEEEANKIENAYSKVLGETMDCYYRAGFYDAIKFLMGGFENGIKI